MKLISSEILWGALAIGWLCYLLVRGKKDQFYVVLLLLIAIGITDYLAYNLLKPEIGRLRPCQEFADMVRIVGGCAGKFGFPSNHAANGAAALAVFWKLGMRPLCRLLLPLVLLVGLSRIYLGVHYPSDILFGYLWGGFCAFTVVHLHSRFLSRHISTESQLET